MIGIITSLPIEARSLTTKRLRVGQTLKLKKDVLLHVSGMGAERANASACHLIMQGATALISFGTAGGLANNLSSGQLIIPEKIIDQHQNHFLTDIELRNHFHDLLSQRITICDAPLLQSFEVITSVEAKQALFQQFQTVAVDMESASVAMIAKQSSIPFVAIRAIVDAAMMSLPAWLPQTFNAKQEVQPLKFAWHLCKYPSSWKTLFHLGQGFSQAKNTLITAAKLIGWRD